MTHAKSLLRFWHEMEKPQLVFRLSRRSTGRKESDADHSWRVAMMAMVIAPKLKKKVKMAKVLMLAIAHDLSEMDHGDVPSYIHSFDPKLKAKKDRDEQKTMRRIVKTYPEFGKKLFDLWKEYEDQKTYESRFLKALDRLDARISVIDDPATRRFSAEKKRKGKMLNAKTSELCSIDDLLMQLDVMSGKERVKKCGF